MKNYKPIMSFAEKAEAHVEGGFLLNEQPLNCCLIFFTPEIAVTAKKSSDSLGVFKHAINHKESKDALFRHLV